MRRRDARESHLWGSLWGAEKNLPAPKMQPRRVGGGASQRRRLLTINSEGTLVGIVPKKER